MNLQESIRRILREEQFDDQQISLKNKIIRHLNHMGYETNKNESDDEIINKLSSLKNDGDTQAGVLLRRITTKIKEKDVHAKAIGTFYRVAGDYIEKFRIGGNQKLQKLIGEDLFYKKGKDWFWNNFKIVNMTTSELKNLIKKIENEFKSPIQESIDKTLNEKTIDITTILRRVRPSELEKEFEESLDMASNMLRNVNNDDGSVMTLERFIDATTSILISGIHHNLYSTISEEYEWYQGVTKSLKDNYKDRIKVRYSKLITQRYNMNLQESIRRILREDISNRGKERLIEMIKTIGVVATSKAVNGVDNLVKILGLEMDDLKTQEMLAKSFIYHADIEDVDILHLEINRDRPDKVRIKIHFNTNNPASNMESWLVRTLCHEMNKFFPFKTAASWEPAFASRGVTVILYSEQIVNTDDDEEI